MSDTPHCNALESNPLDSFDYRAWMTLARKLERALNAQRESETMKDQAIDRHIAARPEEQPIKGHCATRWQIDADSHMVTLFFDSLPNMQTFLERIKRRDMNEGGK